MKIVSIVGARPQFIKAALVCKMLRRRHREILLHTGQHYDDNMSRVFFRDLLIPEPDYNLGVGSSSHGAQTASMLIGIEKVLTNEKPDVVLVYGDTNSTLAGALAAAKLFIPVAHVEAGLRSYNREMPEEINRVLADRIATLLFCPTAIALENLRKEGIVDGAFNTGDVMYDAALFYGEVALKNRDLMNRLELKKGEFMLATLHRAHNTDNPRHLKNILHAFAAAGKRIVFPIHPRTRHFIEAHGLSSLLDGTPTIVPIPPVTYLDMLLLEQNAHKIQTDSGGVQKEAYFFKVPCITLREETEWLETLEDGWNRLVGTDTEAIVEAIQSFAPEGAQQHHYGDGNACACIIELLEAQFGSTTH